MEGKAQSTETLTSQLLNNPLAEMGEGIKQCCKTGGPRHAKSRAEIARVEGSPVQRPLLQMLVQVIASSGHRC